jgi:hypothetical protein
MRCQPKDIRSFILSYDSATLWKTSATRSVFSASDRPSSKPKCVVLSDEVEVLLLFVVGFCAAIDVLKGLAERMEEQEQEREGRKVRVAARKTGRADIFAIPDPRNFSTSPCLRSFRVETEFGWRKRTVEIVGQLVTNPDSAIGFRSSQRNLRSAVQG